MNNSNSTKSFKPVSTIATTNPQFIGFNLADFSLTPVVKKGKSAELVNTRNTHTWTSTVSGRKREFFIERKYGDVAPNSYTEDFLILLATMAFQRDNPTKIPVSATSLLTVQGYTSLPGGDNIHRVFDHLEALTETRIRCMIEKRAHGTASKARLLGVLRIQTKRENFVILRIRTAG